MATKQETFEWKQAGEVANEIRSKLEPHCEPEKILVVGSLRRQCPTVHDIDIVLMPLPGVSVSLFFSLTRWLQDTLGDAWQHLKGKSKIVNGLYAGIPVDLYFATTDTWWTLVVIRTGSAQSNIRLCQRAKSLGMKLHADGSGVEDMDGNLLGPVSESHLFTLLQLPYVEPKDRR